MQVKFFRLRILYNSLHKKAGLKYSFQTEYLSLATFALSLHAIIIRNKLLPEFLLFILALLTAAISVIVDFFCRIQGIATFRIKLL